MSFEAFNGVVKRAANRSNFKNEIFSILNFWSMKSAIGMSRAREVDWLRDVHDAENAMLDAAPNTWM